MRRWLLKWWEPCKPMESKKNLIRRSQIFKEHESKNYVQWMIGTTRLTLFFAGDSLQPGEQHTKDRHKFCVDKIWSMGMNGYSIINLFVMAKAAVQTTQYQTMGVPNLHSFITKPNSYVLLVNRSPLWNKGLLFTTISDRFMQHAVWSFLSPESSLVVHLRTPSNASLLWSYKH